MDALTLFEWTSGRFIPILLRLSTLFTLAPFYGFKNVPVRVRIGLALLVALIVTPVVDVPHLAGYTLSGLIILALQEVLVGALLAFCMVLLFTAAQFGGHISGHQMGLAMANTVDPQGQFSLSVVGEFYYVFAAMLFLCFDGHHFILRAIIHSFQLVPIDSVALNGAVMRVLMRLSADLFLLAVQLAAPVIAALLTTSVALGLIARTVPQMNVFIVGFPLKLGVGFGVAFLSVPVFASAFRVAYDVAQKDALMLLAALSGG